MKELADLISRKYSVFKNELFYADGEFFVLFGSKIAKLADPVDAYEQTLKVTFPTGEFINSYFEENDLDLASFADTLSFYADDFAGYDENDVFTELFLDIDDDVRKFLSAAIDKSISPYRAIKACALLAGGCDIGEWYMEEYGDYKSIISLISAECEMIDFDFTSFEDDEYWRSVIENLPSYIYSGGDIL